MDSITLALFGALVGAFIYFLSLHKHIQRIENKEEAAIREIEKIRKELSEQFIGIAKAHAEKIDGAEKKIERCQDQIKNLHVDVSEIRRDYQVKPEVARLADALASFSHKK